jgi:hypothetical protein
MEHKLPRLQGSVLYCTAGILLHRMASDRGLEQFTHVVLVEVHERDVMADLILAILKQELLQRPDLDVDQFSAYMGDCPALHIPCFMHPVKPHYLEQVLQMTGYTLELHKLGPVRDGPHLRLPGRRPQQRVRGAGEAVMTIGLVPNVAPFRLREEQQGEGPARFRLVIEFHPGSVNRNVKQVGEYIDV